MERNFYTDDFEELLKEKADQYKMYPSDKVWNGIQSSLHSKRKWYWIGFALLLSGVSYYAIEALIAPPARTQKSQVRTAATTATSENVLLTSVDGKTPRALVIPLTQRRNHQQDDLPSANIDQPSYGVYGIDRSSADLEPGATAKVVDMLELANVSVATNVPVANGAGEKRLPSYAPATAAAPLIISLATNTTAPVNTPLQRPDQLKGFQRLMIVDLTIPLPGSMTVPGKAAMGGAGEIGPAGLKGPDYVTAAMRFPVEQDLSAEDAKKINWLQEFASTEFIVPRLTKLSWQLSFAPTINYRKLSTSRRPGKQYMVKNIPMAMDVTGNLDNLVNHKPALGFELGSHLRFAANRSVTFKAGFQFNYARYAIEAFTAPTSDVATIALSSVGGARVDSLISYSSISNFGGNSVKDIQNQYFQLSAPIGMEVKLLGGKKLQLHVAGTIQPTYLLNRNTYLITTDYQSYTHEPSLVRRWNMNTSAEAFVSYNTGGITWQVGPQFRYQILSSYSSQYPIKENLMEYGVKIGVSKTIR